MSSSQRSGLAQTAPFLVLLAAVLTLVVLIPHQTVEQRFYIRIAMGLAAAGVAALIPGFLELEARWLRNVLRAGGALAVFVIIYMFNPPELLAAQAPAIPDIGGRWNYSCTTIGKPFPHGGYSHGGTVDIAVIPGPYYTAIELVGRRTWVEQADGTREHLLRENPWKSTRGVLVSATEFGYDYITADNNEDFRGHTHLSLISNEDGLLSLEGDFYRISDTQYVKGIVKYTRPLN